MSGAKHSGGPAVPSAVDPVTDLRDWFAGSLDVRDIQFPDFASAANWMDIDPPDQTDFASMLDFTFKLNAFIRYKMADEMIAARANDENAAAMQKMVDDDRAEGIKKDE